MYCKILWLGFLAVISAVWNISPALAAPAQQFTLTEPTSSFLLLPDTPRRDLRLDFSLRYEKPGVILDTVGINAAPVGSWALSIDAEGRFCVQIYDPAQQSAGRVPNGWHLLTSRQKLAAGQQHRLLVDFAASGVSLRIDEDTPQTLALNTPLSGQAVWLGDFPGDDHWGARYRIHPAFIGAIAVHYAGSRQTGAIVKNDETAIIDETGTLTREEIQHLAGVLARVEAQFNVRLALVFAAPAEEAALKEHSAQLRQSLIVRGTLPATRSALILFAGNAFRYHRDTEIDRLLPWETVRAAWEKTTSPGRPAMSARQFLENLLPAPITVPAPVTPPIVQPPDVQPPDVQPPVTPPLAGTPPAAIAAQVESGVRAIETACRTGRVDEVQALLTPDGKNTLAPMLNAHQGELRRLADLLATCKLQFAAGNYAELQASEAGHTFTVTLEKIAGVWRLATF